MFKNVIFLCVIGLLISSCSNKTQKKIGIVDEMPDESNTTLNKSLVVPPFLNKQMQNLESE